MKKIAKQVDMMHAAGFMSSREAADATGMAHVSSIIKLIKDQRVEGQQVGYQWYVKAKSLLTRYEGSPIEKSIRDKCTEVGVVIDPPEQSKASGA